ncbi:MAG: RHS repeat-associated core domain-containing protein [Gemmatimonadaceae bacterium]|nr:RHS repeat-associated core domain-containing protein [Gemmatimonadaceae bacterium]
MTRVAISPLGAPTRITDPLGRVTTVAHHPVFLGLTESTTAPNGYTTRANYDARGNAVELRADPVPGLFSTPAVTTVQYHPVWDLPTQITSPVGVTETRTYQSTQPLLQSVRTGPTTERQQIFSYCTGPDCPTGLLKSIARRDQVTWQQVWHPCPDGSITCEESMVPDSIAITTPGAVLQTVTYDARGNAIATETNGGKRQEMERDAIGRITRRRELVGLNATQTAWRVTTDSLDLRDLLIERRSSIPGYADSLRVENVYDVAGATVAVRRIAMPDRNSIGLLTDTTIYDAIGRVIAQRGPGNDTVSGVVRTYYDPNGNADSVRTARGHVIRMQHDALDRLTLRMLPPVTYALDSSGLAASARILGPDASLTYPDPTPGWGLSLNERFTLPGDTVRFHYDLHSGQVDTATNRHARVTRSYYANGQLAGEIQSMRPYAGGGYEREYSLHHTYDAAGRLTQLAQPLATFAYSYDPTYGELASVRAGGGDTVSFAYDSLGRVFRKTAGNAYQDYLRTLDGEALVEYVRTLGATPTRPWPHLNGQIRQTTAAYSIDGKVLSLAGGGEARTNMTNTYTALGALGSSIYGAWLPFAHGGLTDSTRTGLLVDALANTSQSIATVVREGYVTTQSPIPFSLGSDPFRGYRSTATTATHFVYAGDGTGRLLQKWTEVSGDTAPQTNYRYDVAGNTVSIRTPIRQGSGSAFNPSVAGEDRLMYYDAEDRLRVTEARRTDLPNTGTTVLRLIQRDEAWYDPFGRRIQLASRRRCYPNDTDLASVPCLEAHVQRTVWAGAQEVYEERVPLNPAYATPAIAPGDAAWAQVPVLPVATFANGYFDPNPFFGAVAYGYATTLDQPVMVVRAGYRDYWDLRPQYYGPHPTQHALYAPPAFTMYPHWNLQGYANLGTARDGGQYHCGSGDCTFAATWGMTWSPFDPEFSRRGAWMGSLLEDKRDGNGLLYRRNRYVDPQSGRFTQQDPIGIAGGLNLYGFANGDPVNYADPFGLKCEARSSEHVVCTNITEDDLTAVGDFLRGDSSDESSADRVAAGQPRYHGMLWRPRQGQEECPSHILEQFSGHHGEEVWDLVAAGKRRWSWKKLTFLQSYGGTWASARTGWQTQGASGTAYCWKGFGIFQTPLPPGW